MPVLERLCTRTKLPWDGLVRGAGEVTGAQRKRVPRSPSHVARSERSPKLRATRVDAPTDQVNVGVDNPEPDRIEIAFG